MEIFTGFQVNYQYIRTGFLKCRSQLFWFINHQVYVKDFLRSFSDMFDYRNAKTYIWHKSAIHYIQMKPISLTFVDKFTNFCKIQEIRCKQRRSDKGHAHLY